MVLFFFLFLIFIPSVYILSLLLLYFNIYFKGLLLLNYISVMLSVSIVCSILTHSLPYVDLTYSCQFSAGLLLYRQILCMKEEPLQSQTLFSKSH
jgi:hypothetical protein